MSSSLPQQAVAELRAGRWSEALRLSTGDCEREPRSPLAWHVRGLAALEGGLLSEAEAALARAAALAPQASALRGPLGVALLRQGCAVEARPHLEAAAGSPWIDTHRGVAAFLVGDGLAACAILRESTRLLPGEVLGWRYLGLAALERGWLDEAAAAWTQVSALCAQDPEGPTMLGVVRGRQGDGAAAVRHLRAALRRDAADTTALRQLGARLVEQGALSEAAATYTRLPAEDPVAISGLALIDERRGHLEAAAERLAPLLLGGELPVVAAEVWARVCLRRDQPERALPFLQRALATTVAPDDQRVLLHALGDVEDAQGHVDAAFLAWTRANALQGVSFDPDAHARLVAQRCAGLGDVGPVSGAGARPVFIVGMPRSGTSLLERMLNRHPSLRGVGERQEIGRVAAHLGGQPLPTRATASLWAAWYTSRVGADRVVDKMPHNFYHLGLIRQLFPEARVLWLRRAPEDVALSCFRQRFGPGMAYTTRLEWLGAVYQGHERLMRHGQVSGTLPILEVHYDALVADPTAVLVEILDFLGEPWEEACVQGAPGGEEGVVATASYAQVQRPLYTSSVGRSAPYHAVLAPFRAALVQGERGTIQAAPALLSA